MCLQKLWIFLKKNSIIYLDLIYPENTPLQGREEALSRAAKNP